MGNPRSRHRHRRAEQKARRAARPGPDGGLGHVEEAVEEAVARAWARGWQPADLHRVAVRYLEPVQVDLLRCALAAEAEPYRDLGGRIAPGWIDQLDEVGAATVERPYVHHDRFDDVLPLLALLDRLPTLPLLVDPPATWSARTSVVQGRLPPRVLERVRALLAKAESTTFDAEAEALTAKAQELMARHRIDRAVVEAAGEGEGERPVGRRIGVDDPYADARAMLLGTIAGANGCRAVWYKELGFSTVFGFPGELAAVEELYTSLLLQATAAMRREGSKTDVDGRSRTRRFRRSFLVAYGSRVGHRLREVVAETVEEASTEIGRSLVPVLAARDDAVDDALHEALGDGFGSFAPSATDAEGWHKGTWWADQADLGAGPALDQAG